MTDLLTRPSQARTPAGPAGGHRRLASDALLAAAGALGGSAALVVLVAVVAWAADSRSGSSVHAAASVALGALLLAQRVRVGLAHGSLSLPPLGLTLVPALLLARAGGALVRVRGLASLRSSAGPVLLTTLLYATGLAALAALVTRPAEHVSPVAAAASGLVLGSVTVTAGAWRALGAAAPRLRRPVADVGRAALAGVAVLVAAGGLVAGASLALHAHDSTQISALLGPGAVGGAVLLLLQLALVPNAAVMTVGVLAGPGFALGRGTSVGVHHVHVGALPALPMLAAVPPNGHPGGAAGLLLAVPLLAGAVVGMVLLRRLPAALSWRQAAGRALGAGALGAFVLTVLLALAGGSGGPGRLAEVGPSAWRVGLVLLAELAVPAAAVVTGARWVRPGGLRSGGLRSGRLTSGRLRSGRG